LPKHLKEIIHIIVKEGVNSVYLIIEVVQVSRDLGGHDIDKFPFLANFCGADFV
jgi:hypothetical protein